MKGLKLLLKIVGGIVALCAVLLAGLVGLAHTDYVQQRALKEATELLRSHLKTHVEIGSVQLSLFGQDISIRDVAIEDLQHRKMLQVERLGVSVDLWRLLDHELYITEAKLAGLEAQLYKPRRDSAANFQFVIDAFAKKGPKDKKKEPGVKKNKLALGVEKLTLERIKVSYNDTLQGRLGYLFYKMNS